MAAIDRATQVWGDAASWPSFAQTARLLALDRSTLTKHAQAGQIRFIRRGFGRGERRVPPLEVLRLAEQYHRVPVGEVRQGLAHEVARRFHVDESELLKGLDDLHQARTGSTPSPVATDSHAMNASAAEVPATGGPAGGQSSPSKPPIPPSREIDLGPLRPRVVAREGFPSPEFLAALDARLPRLPDVRIERGMRREIDLGRLHPGLRF